MMVPFQVGVKNCCVSHRGQLTAYFADRFNITDVVPTFFFINYFINYFLNFGG